MSANYFQSIRELLGELGYRADHLCEEKMRRLVNKVKRALANADDIDELLGEAIESMAPPAEE